VHYIESVPPAEPAGTRRTLEPATSESESAGSVLETSGDEASASVSGSGSGTVVGRLPDAPPARLHPIDREFAYKELQSVPRAPYRAEFETVQLGDRLGVGASKLVYKIVGHEDLAIGRLIEPSRWSDLVQEIETINKLADLKFPVAKVVGVTIHDDVPAIVMQLYPGGGSRPIVFGNDPTSVLTAQSVHDLQKIRQQLIDLNMGVSDLQFLIGARGEIYINDPVRLAPFDRETTVPADQLLNLAIEEVLRQHMTLGETLLDAELRARIPVEIKADVWKGFIKEASDGPKPILQQRGTGVYTLRPPRKVRR